MKAKTALVTGATGGIGSAIVSELEDAGIQVHAESMKAYGDWEIPLEVDIFINASGIFPYTELKDISYREIAETFNANVIYPIFIIKELLIQMIARGSGTIINIGSSACYQGEAKHTIYAATKHALLGFSRALDDEVRQYGIRVHCLSPASVDTPMAAGRADIPKDSLISPKEVAEAVMYLLRSDGPGIVNELRMWRINR